MNSGTNDGYSEAEDIKLSTSFSVKINNLNYLQIYRCLKKI
jgi:hypothetical protein